MKLRIVFLPLLVLTTLVLTTLFVVPALVSGQEEPDWPNEYEEEGEEQLPGGALSDISWSIATPPPGTPASIVTAHFEDASGIARNEVIGSEVFFLVLQVNQRGRLYVAEYYPSGTVPQWHWLMYGVRLTSGGEWILGPFYAETSEPEGQHSWIMRFYAPNVFYDEYVIRFDYHQEKVVTPQDVSTSVVISSLASSLKAGDMCSVFGTLSPMVGGVITIEQSEDGMTWLPIGSGPATSSVVAQFKADKPGGYFVRAKYNGCLDTTANKNYLPSQSVPISLQVTAKRDWVIPLAIALGVVAAGAIGFLVSRRLSRAKAQ